MDFRKQGHDGDEETTSPQSTTTSASAGRFVDAGEIARFLRYIDSDADKFVFFSGDDNKERRKADVLRRKRKENPVGPLADHYWGTVNGAMQWMTGRQSRGANIAITVQAMKRDKRKKEQVSYIRAVFAELDNGMPEVPWPIEPSLIVETSKDHFHVYWLVDPNDPMSEDDFANVMMCLVERYGSDPDAKDLARALRVPGTWNLKPDREPFLVNLCHEAGYRYGCKELMQMFPAPALPKKVVGDVRRPRFPKRAAGDLDRFVEALAAVPADNYGDWLNVGFALHHESGGSQAGLDLWDRWSGKSESWAPAVCADKWQSMTYGRGITGGKIYHLAAENGWTPPARTARPTQSATPRHGGEQSTTPPAPPARSSTGPSSSLPEWEEVTKNAAPRARSQANIRAFLLWAGAEFAYNAFTCRETLTINGEARPVNDETLRRLRLQADELGLSPPQQFFDDVCLDLANRNQFHPVRDRLDATLWDGTPRIDKWLHRYARAADTILNEAFGRKHLIAAVRRVRHPGTKHDSCLVCEGEQGVGKSSLVRVLAWDDWFSDVLSIGATPKEVIELTEGAWLVEIAELSGIRRSEIETVKAMISRQSDRARLAYGRHTHDRPRQFVLFGTVNESQYLRDTTGNRRFWPVKVGNVDLAGLRQVREQLWAEAAFYEARGETLELPEHLWSEAARAQEERLIADPWAERLETWLEGKTGTVLIDTVWQKLEIKSDRQDGNVGQRVARIMAKLGSGWMRKKTKQGWAYSTQPKGETLRWIYGPGSE